VAIQYQKFFSIYRLKLIKDCIISWNSKGRVKVFLSLRFQKEILEVSIDLLIKIKFHQYLRKINTTKT
jgi:hypothetical protein